MKKIFSCVTVVLFAIVTLFVMSNNVSAKEVSDIGLNIELTDWNGQPHTKPIQQWEAVKLSTRFSLPNNKVEKGDVTNISFPDILTYNAPSAKFNVVTSNGEVVTNAVVNTAERKNLRDDKKKIINKKVRSVKEKIHIHKSITGIANDIPSSLKLNEEEFNTKTELAYPLTLADFAGKFTFKLKSTDGKVNVINDTATNDEFGIVTFDDLEFKEEGTYQFTVEEVKGNVDGITYDTTPRLVTIEVKLEGSVLVATVVNDFVQIINHYNEPVEVVIEATKKITRRKLKEGEFLFKLERKDGTGSAITTTNKADGTITFAPIRFTEVGTYTYILTEVKGVVGGVKYDKTSYEIVINVINDGTGKLVATVDKKATDLVFDNIYTPTSAKATIKAKKTLIGRELKDQEFEFTLINKDTKEIIKTVKNDGTGIITFPELTFDTPGLYVYTVKEKVGFTKDIEYDKVEYDVVVKVTDDEKGALIAEIDKDESVVRFVNKYVPTTTTTVLPTTMTEATTTTVLPTTMTEATTTTVSPTTTTEATTTTVSPTTTMETTTTTVASNTTESTTTVAPMTTTVVKPILPKTGSHNNPLWMITGLAVLLAGAGFAFAGRKEN